MQHEGESVELKPDIRRLAIAVRGVVQGVGFRPFVFNAARSRNLSGWVRNESDTVRIEVEGERAALDGFLAVLREAHPPAARIDSIDVSQTDCLETPDEGFQIRLSAGGSSSEPMIPGPTIPADLATCDQCLDEIRDPAQRRFGHAFANCTNCGPRWSIIEGLPYDRPRTSMARFQMCPDCQAEYRDPADRRFHAQPIACPRCGPTLRLLDRHGNRVADDNEALDAAAEAVLAGRIVAIKGLGGYQLVCDATNDQAVSLLRERKQRPAKPLAVMLSTLDETRLHCRLSDEEARTMSSPAAPILLLRRRSDGEPASRIAEVVAPGNPYLGAMLPYTPLHHLLMAKINRPIVCTSGNLSEEPMATRTDDALARLGHVADIFLAHNRPIVRPVDDSVARVGPDGLQVLRRARGYAPLAIGLGVEKGTRFNLPERPGGCFAQIKPGPFFGPGGPTILAVGGHLKNTVAIGLGDQAVLSQHVGDLDNVPSVELFERTIGDLVDFFRVTPDVVACDLHPDYASTRHGERLAAGWDVPLVRVQHHHAHAAACIAEHRLEGPVLGLAWDGTGYGSDGTVWGGEALLCERAEFVRVAHLRTFALPGADRAVRQPRRSALGVLYEILGDGAIVRAGEWFSESELNVLAALLARSIHAPRTSSMGRLFDAVAAICSLGDVISFEGQAAMALEFAADWRVRDAYPLPLGETVPAVADWEPLVRAVLADRAAGRPVEQIAARFHNSLAQMALAIAQRAGCPRIVLSGGCFQNALLTDRVRPRRLEAGFAVYTHKKVPPGDGAIALGQVLVARRRTM